jgi:hypothetical protein
VHRRALRMGAGGEAPSLAPAPAASLPDAAPASAPAPSQQPVSASGGSEDEGSFTVTEIDLTAAGLPQVLREPQPAWVAAGDISWMPRQRLEQHAANVAAVAAVNASGQRPDLIMWGDSLTALSAFDSPAPWAAHFGDLAAAAGGGGALPLGVNGSTIENLAWRIVQGGERPAAPPRVAVLLVGVNNLYKGQYRPEDRPGPLADKLEWLVRWLQATMPRTQVGALLGRRQRLRLQLHMLQQDRDQQRYR